MAIFHSYVSHYQRVAGWTTGREAGDPVWTKMVILLHLWRQQMDKWDFNGFYQEQLADWYSQMADLWLLSWWIVGDFSVILFGLWELCPCRYWDQVTKVAHQDRQEVDMLAWDSGCVGLPSGDWHTNCWTWPGHRNSEFSQLVFPAIGIVGGSFHSHAKIYQRLLLVFVSHWTNMLLIGVMSHRWPNPDENPRWPGNI